MKSCETQCAPEPVCCEPMTCEQKCDLVIRHLQKYHPAMVTVDLVLLIGIILVVIMQCRILRCMNKR